MSIVSEVLNILKNDEERKALEIYQQRYGEVLSADLSKDDVTLIQDGSGQFAMVLDNEGIYKKYLKKEIDKYLKENKIRFVWDD